jgi:exopolysaccharide biosynthesis polyprenyl glycosylphosphotransferase
MIPRRIFWLFDILVLTMAFLLAYAAVPVVQGWLAPGGALYQPWLERLAPASGVLPPVGDLLWVLLTTTVASLLCIELTGGYRRLVDQSYARLVLTSLGAPLVGLSLITLALFALKSPGDSRLFIFLFVAFSSLGLGVYRILFRIYFLRRRNAGYYAKNVVLIGAPSGIEWMARYFAGNPATVEHRLMGYMAVDEGGAQRALNGVPCLGHVEQIGDMLISRPIHEVIVVHPTAGGDWIEQVIRDCDYMGVLLRIVPEALLLGERRVLQTLYPFEPLHLPAVVLAPPHLDSHALFIKRMFDIVVSAVLLVLLLPVFALIALAIKITTPDLPVFYQWRVVGRNGVDFVGYKFTTMYPDADQRKAALMAQNEMSGPVFKIKNDPRVTPMGRFLRKYSLNELPQIWSVLKGDMSLVGPRPAFRHELERYEFWHKRKLSIRPGITCLWQVSGRNKISNFDDWVRLDLEYIDNWSLWLDVKILARTAWAVVAGTGS